MKNNILHTNNLTEENLMMLIESRIEEGLHYSFKKGNEVPITEKQIEKLTLEITAFANTLGGCIIYGIESKRKKAHSFSFLKNTDFSVSKLDIVLQSRINRPIPNLKIQYVEIQNDKEKSVLIITIPESSEAPHMASDKCFYKRLHNKFSVMEEFEVRQMYGKLSKSNLEFVGIVNTNGIPSLTDGLFNHVIFLPRFIIRNTGSAIERFYKFEIAIPSPLCDENYYALNTYFNRHEGIYSIFSIPGKAPVFQDEMTSITEIKLLITKENLELFLTENIKITLFYSEGMRSSVFNLSDTFMYNNKMLEKNLFC
ncbi:MAG: hypothetical protein A2275_11215 [Bacteroidetes bacterium RIFOXYA12_FULL_35_11]|nr:MAG: hypothetical protein A2X01_19160 [Bacteroidetes bacterium GWF2_35_48]OFY74410.1 MAG: hypothetical protein A2275_11215 [Bacteroidetes bacterium RIFOXYA12_FULL_35_11]OFY93578.1 MAG: hypothetical protein A2491_00830 [Bacteroidetes bacterium RIFOXYC12_FULL_35_7]OFY96461.1 MAG: hypothetical protein A2309_12245 [Bacteroidetes bacterium RIFOXYB2_FULL_35_7]HBX50714.1 hypothetical protein [Bacteroidales bacterium]